ncbi:MAG: hypothetical protein CFE26_22535 [Verrucomicrobiales bacterium VVV1]|nr:MAG: hypothetical protein CFE26_22535 [Verrucomicrobiales bacterium VVV1]
MLVNPVDATAIATCAASRKVIVQHSVLVAGASLIRIPLADSLTVTAVQLAMFRALARLHRRPEDDRELSAVLASIGGGMLSFLIGRSGPALAFKTAALAIPVVGPLVRYGAGPALMAGYTWVLGEAFRRHFAAGGSTRDFTVKRFREIARDLMPQGSLG